LTFIDAQLYCGSDMERFFPQIRSFQNCFSIILNDALVIGFMIIGLAILSSKGGGVVEISLAVGGLFNGPIFGVFLVGFLLPKCNSKGVWTGFILSSVSIKVE
ncbi:hypothetical protein Avbf_03359, partial [Armadillidium vulgare]